MRFCLHIAHITHIGVTVDWKWVAGWGSEKAGSGSSIVDSGWFVRWGTAVVVWTGGGGGLGLGATESCHTGEQARRLRYGPQDAGATGEARTKEDDMNAGLAVREGNRFRYGK